MNPRYLILICLLIVADMSAARNSDRSNRYRPMAESLMDMMDAFSEAYARRKPQQNLPGMGTQMPWNQSMLPMTMGGGAWSQGLNPWSQGVNPWSMGGSPWSGLPYGSMPGMTPGGSPWQGFAPPTNWWDTRDLVGAGQLQPQAGLPASYDNRLDGNWRGRSGEVLVIRNGRFRIYKDRDNFREGVLRIDDQDTLTMSDPNSGSRRQYEFAEKDGRLALRDADNNLLLYKRIK